MPLITKALFKPIGIGLCWLIAVPCGAQQQAPTRLDIVLIQGDGVTSNIRRRASTDPVVRVQNERGEPVSGATVVFTLPTEGATGNFAGEKTTVVTTDDRGEAAPKTLKFNAVPGRVPIHVAASYRGLVARAIITQTTVVPPGEKAGSDERRGHGKLIAVLVALGAAAGGGAAYAMSQGKQQPQQQSTTPPASGPVPIGITPGTGTIAGGR